MRMIGIIALLVSQSLLAGPASAAPVHAPGAAQVGAFGGLRLRIPLGGETGDRPARLSLALAPVAQIRAGDGAPRSGTSDGLELAVGDRGALRLSLAGEPIERLAARARADGDESGSGTRTILIIGGIAVALGVGALVFWDAMEDASE